MFVNFLNNYMIYLIIALLIYLNDFNLNLNIQDFLIFLILLLISFH